MPAIANVFFKMCFVLGCLWFISSPGIAFQMDSPPSTSHQDASKDPEALTHFVKAQRVSLMALDKVTTSVIELEGVVGQTLQFGTLEITLKAAYRTPMDEVHESAVYLVIRDAPRSKESREIFSGWMFASSPALSPFAHAVYDIWVKECHLSETKPNL